ncbi:MAG: carbohydrate kinase family protein [Candidatus Heimdallarchaeota archaeon]|nr:MAG: carbohydrate kinase family protein [Candidatus Heimdallarchaeota archaeon]
MFSIDFETAFNKIKQLKMTVLPDFFLDVIIDPHMPYEQLIQEIQTVYSRGGGNLLGPEARFIAGGNGGNVAKTLAGLGISTTFICETSQLGKQLIEFFMHPLGVKTLITTTGDMASSIILEIPHGTDKHNVMFSTSGSVTDFSSKKLTPEQWNVLKESHSIAICNAQNYQMEDLVEAILREVPPSIAVSVDFSDLTPHLQRIEGFRHRILEHPTRSPSFITGNETEVQLLAKEHNKTPEEAIKILSSSYSEIIFGLHMATKAEIWKNGEQLSIEPCFKISVLNATGAGDSWHAGFMTGWKLGLSISESTIFANAVAAYQISTGKIGSLKEIISFKTSTPCYNLST